MDLNTDNKSEPVFMAGGGAAGELMRSVDWASSQLGAADDWPGSLKTTVGTLLHSRHPMFLWWGAELIQFYNDAYVPSFGHGKHPTAMGQRGADCWQEIWPIIWPQIANVMTHGTPSWHEDHLVPIFRNGRIEEVYWTYGYSPVFDEQGRISGTLVVCTETTARVVAQRRLTALRDCSERINAAADADAVLDCAADLFGRMPGDVVFALIYLIGGGEPVPALVRSVGLSGPQRAGLDAALRQQLACLARLDAPIPVPEGVTLSGALWPEPVSQLFVSGIAIPGSETPSGYVVFGLSPRLPVDHGYRDHLGQLGAQIAQAQARLDAFQLRVVIENERNNLLLQAPVATALMTGPEHVFVLANSLFLEVVGRADIVGQTYLAAFPELRGTPLPGILDRVYATGTPFVTHEMRIPLDRNHDGVSEDCFFRFNLEPIRDAFGRVYGMMAVAVDITEQVSARRVMEKNQAEREVLLEELKDASRAKDEFLAMLGHELRNPLAPILTALQLMRLRGVSGADRERAVIERQVTHVVRLVDDLLDISRITRGKIRLKREILPVAEIVAKAVEMVSPLIEQQGHRLSVDVPRGLAVLGDAARLAQVVGNVVTNAAKYTEAGGDIWIRAERVDDEIRLSVRDSGVGIEPATMPHVFEPFAQERQESDRSLGGLGLGLAIVRSLVEAHRVRHQLAAGDARGSAPCRGAPAGDDRGRDRLSPSPGR
jgi:signal transduction histidine kinase